MFLLQLVQPFSPTEPTHRANISFTHLQTLLASIGFGRKGTHGTRTHHFSYPPARSAELFTAVTSAQVALNVQKNVFFLGGL